MYVNSVTLVVYPVTDWILIIVLNVLALNIYTEINVYTNAL